MMVEGVSVMEERKHWCCACRAPCTWKRPCGRSLWKTDWWRRGWSRSWEGSYEAAAEAQGTEMTVTTDALETQGFTRLRHSPCRQGVSVWFRGGAPGKDSSLLKEILIRT